MKSEENGGIVYLSPLDSFSAFHGRCCLRLVTLWEQDTTMRLALVSTVAAVFKTEAQDFLSTLKRYTILSTGQIGDTG